MRDEAVRTAVQEGRLDALDDLKGLWHPAGLLEHSYSSGNPLNLRAHLLVGRLNLLCGA